MTGAEERGDHAPLAGVIVLDASRMLPGAVLVRMLADLGARVIKIEDPGGGDPLRHTPPLVNGVGAGFCAFFRGCESVALDLQDPAGAASLRRLSRHADVLIESFRPGTLESWGLDARRLAEANPALILCSLSGFGQQGAWRRRAAHDLNFAAQSGLLDLFGSPEVPRVQAVDVTAGLLAASGILAALLRRARTGRGIHLDQPLAAAPLPFLTWAWADAAAGGGGADEGILAGKCPAYHVYSCADGRRVALGAIEPKFWNEVTALLGLPELAGAGLDLGEVGVQAAARVASRLATQPASHWLALASERGLPLTLVSSAGEARLDPYFAEAGLLEETPTPGGQHLTTPAPYLPTLGRTPGRPAPRLGEHTARVLKELGGVQG
ncbi:MAG: CoA transferase [Acidobacteriota bacterium]